jgi:hypothetical protein
MRLRILFALLAVAASAVIGLAACGGGDDDSAAGTSAPAQSGTSTGMDGDMDMAAPDTMTPAADLRVTLDTLLGEHAVLAMVATQKGLDGAPDFEAAAAALDENAVAVSEAIGSVYGDEAAKQFLDGPSLWRDHISFFVDYTVALAGQDKAAQQEAVDNLIGYTGAFSGFLAGATGLPQDALQEGVTMHVMQLKGALDSYAAGNYERSYRLFREAYGHMLATGDTLAAAIVEQSPDSFE